MARAAAPRAGARRRASARNASRRVLRRRAGRLRGRHARSLLVHAVPACGRERAARRRTRRDRHVRRAGGARRPSRRGARSGLVLCAQPLRDRRPLPQSRRRRRAGRLRLARRRLQAPSARARGCARDARRGRAERARGHRARQALRRARGDLGALPHGRQPPPPRSRRARVPSRRLGLLSRPAGVLAAARPRRRERDPDVQAARVRPLDALPAARPRRPRARWRFSARRASSAAVAAR